MKKSLTMENDGKMGEKNTDQEHIAVHKLWKKPWTRPGLCREPSQYGPGPGPLWPLSDFISSNFKRK